MPDEFVTHEMWPFECLRCLHVWEVRYVVKHLSDAYGNEADIWLSGGVPAPPPWAGTSCPGCGAYHVTWFPNGYLARHPELVSGPEPEPEPVRVPAVTRVPARAPAARRSARPGRLAVALGVPLALFVGYEVYINLGAVHMGH
ncbi:hypothetical protein SAMN05421874_11333 [Nonomuraea maritima]|jgi:hypothetical protein|uniref:Uncharacterized protein n=1 Tax=Nonomuraea maritima TaxID=683260 RepID=A0A1G9FVT6_9ACTN|nr:hypothetical protein [Nonomuraea maritima]SDK92452.1 hypothetical protein SAMN05421874_11333 [Nonomuraea maritima]